MTSPGAVTLGLARAGVELKSFLRERDAVVFTFALPIVMLIILGSVFGGDIDGTDIVVNQLFAAGIIAGGVASTSFVTLGIGIPTDRDNGTLKRLRGTPMPAVSYFLGKILLVIATSLAEVVIMLMVGRLLFDLSLPATAERWWTFTWVFVLGVTSCSLLGIAATSLTRTARSAGAFMNLSLLVLQFASGIYFIPITELPDPLTQFGALLPLKWMAQGFRSVFLPDSAASVELAGAWEHGRTALVLGAWCIGGLILCLTTFRWRSRRDS